VGTRGQRRAGLILSLAVSIVILALYFRGSLAALEAWAYDSLMPLRTDHSGAGNIVLVVVDDRSLDAVGEWPWPRSRHAQLIRRLMQAGPPKAIVFDLLFLRRRGHAQEDAALAREMKKAGNVFLAMYFAREEKALRVGKYGVRMARMNWPAAALAKAARGVGPVNVFPDQDGVVRAAPVALECRGRAYPSLPVLAAGFTCGARTLKPRITLGKYAHLGPCHIPVDHAGEMLIHFAGPYGTITSFSCYDILEGRAAPRSFAGKVVVVGFSAAGMSDSHSTPVSPAMPGVEINAHIIGTILERAYSKRASPLATAALILLAGVLVGLVVPRSSPGAAVAASLLLAAALVSAGIIFLQTRGLWFPIVTPALTVGAALLATTADAYRRTQRDDARLESSLSTLALATRMLGASTSRSTLIAALREEIRELVEARRCDVFLLEEESGNLVLLSATGEPADPPLILAPGEGLAGRATQQSKTIMMQRASEWPPEAEAVERLVGFTPGSIIAVPLKHHDRLLGAVQVVRRNDAPPFGERQAALLNALAFEAAVALENAELYEKLEGRVELANRQLVRAYRELEAEKERLGALLSNMADAVLMTDPHHRIVYLNPAAEALLNVRGTELMGSELTSLDVPGLAELVQSAKGEIVTAQLSLAQPEPRSLSAAARQISGSEGAPIGTVTVLTDVTVLQQLSELKTELVRHVSHEIRGPLTPIRGFAEVLLGEGDKHDAETREFLGIISHQSLRLERLVDGLLDAARLDAGHDLQLNLQSLRLAPVLERVIALERLGTETHTFRVEIPDDLPPLLADEARLEQVLINLVHNAVKYSREGGEILISASQQDKQVHISVKDQGMGMSPQEIAQLFQPFYRIQRDAEKRIKGTGLGLYLVRQLVELHGGRVWAESPGPGQGSTFNFTIPLAQST
jgi:signal transduction histidine kinase/CHASE2 domain-containing sensor protein